MREFITDLWEEASDFFEDIYDHLIDRDDDHRKATVEVSINGLTRKVRPAYIFAQRIEAILILIISCSIIISAVTASFLGFPTLSDLLHMLIFSWWGRCIMIIIGLSYFLISVWRLLHLGTKRI